MREQEQDYANAGLRMDSLCRKGFAPKVIFQDGAYCASSTRVKVRAGLGATVNAALCQLERRLFEAGFVDGVAQ